MEASASDSLDGVAPSPYPRTRHWRTLPMDSTTLDYEVAKALDDNDVPYARRLILEYSAGEDQEERLAELPKPPKKG